MRLLPSRRATPVLTGLLAVLVAFGLAAGPAGQGCGPMPTPSAGASAAAEEDPDGPLDLTDGEQETGWLYLTSDDPFAATGSWRERFPRRQEAPSDSDTLFASNNGPDPTGDMAHPVFEGQVIGQLQTMAIYLYRGTFINEFEPQEQLHITLEVDGAVLFDEPTPVETFPGRPDVCHGGHYGSYYVEFADFEQAMQDHGLRLDGTHEISVRLAATGTGTDRPPLEIFAVDSVVTASGFTFNARRAFGEVVSLAD